jgi:prophage tail gpP-like protein
VDPLVGFADEFVIAEVNYKLSGDGGMLTTLKVGPKDGYVNKPAKKSKGAGDEWSDVRPADGRKVITNRPTSEFGDVKR